MKAVMISIQPKWCEPIANGKKTIEVRKTKPKLETPFKCYIYCTKDNIDSSPKRVWWKSDKSGYRHIMNGKVIGEFVCDGIISHCEMANADIAEQQGRIRREELAEYSNGKELFGWHISDLVIYDKPKELSEFKKHNRHCHYEHLGLATPKCSECKECQLERPPQSWCYVEEQTCPTKKTTNRSPSSSGQNSKAASSPS